uniref:Inhibitor I9 domain-containing protein n=1 Tax=Oryza barthii TaxID=65489 RepID=A0A0D3FS50_9ORYZ
MPGRMLPMATSVFLLLSALLLLLPLQTSYFVVAQPNNKASKKLYIAYLGEKQHEDPQKITASHQDMLTRILGSKEAALESIIYSYKHAFSGFAARLTESQAQKIADYTKPTGLLHDAKYGDSIIIGIIDTDIWPESASFSDHGLSPIPSKWKGQCQAGEAFRSNQCNRKIIGARWYDKHFSAENLKGEYRSARDADGHRTHVASTAADALVPNTSFHGLAAGYTRGVAPRAWFAIYKICWIQVYNGVAMKRPSCKQLTTSYTMVSIFENAGSFHAVKNDITVIFAAGNGERARRTVMNTSPWAISVVSATIDGALPTVITLANSAGNYVIC